MKDEVRWKGFPKNSLLGFITWICTTDIKNSSLTVQAGIETEWPGIPNVMKWLDFMVSEKWLSQSVIFSVVGTLSVTDQFHSWAVS